MAVGGCDVRLVGLQVIALMRPFMHAAGCPGKCCESQEWKPPCHIGIALGQIAEVLKMWWKNRKGITKSLEDIEAELDVCFEHFDESKMNPICKKDAITFTELIELLRPLSKSMGFGKERPRQYRLDKVLCVQSGLRSSHISGSRFKVSGMHFNEKAVDGEREPLAVEVTLEASSESKAKEWVG